MTEPVTSAMTLREKVAAWARARNANREAANAVLRDVYCQALHVRLGETAEAYRAAEQALLDEVPWVEVAWEEKP